MNATATLPPEVADYLDQVRAALADVPAEERDEMLADLEVSLLEGAAETAEPPATRLGPPERFAQELRAAAGIQAAPAAPPAPGLRERLHALLAGPRGRAALATARELIPVWWVVRGYVAACALALMAGLNWSHWALVPGRDAPMFGVLLVLAGVAGSIWLGLRERDHHPRRRSLIALNAVIALLALPIGAQALAGPDPQFVEISYAPAPEFVEGLVNDGHRVRNLYPYSRDGKLLLDVLLYDELGQPLDVGSVDPQEDPLRRYLLTSSGDRLMNSFPIRYVEPGTSKVEHPTSAPAEIEIPKIETPPLKVRRP